MEAKRPRGRPRKNKDSQSSQHQTTHRSDEEVKQIHHENNEEAKTSRNIGSTRSTIEPKADAQIVPPKQPLIFKPLETILEEDEYKSDDFDVHGEEQSLAEVDSISRAS